MKKKKPIKLLICIATLHGFSFRLNNTFSPIASSTKYFLVVGRCPFPQMTGTLSPVSSSRRRWPVTASPPCSAGQHQVENKQKKRYISYFRHGKNVLAGSRSCSASGIRCGAKEAGMSITRSLPLLTFGSSTWNPSGPRTFFSGGNLSFSLALKAFHDSAPSYLSLLSFFFFKSFISHSGSCGKGLTLRPRSWFEF